MNIKMFGLKDLVNFASASGDGKIYAHAKFLSRSPEFYKKEITLVG